MCNFVKDVAELNKEKECYVSFVEVPTRQKLRELNASKFGTLIRISGQVIRTHPVHPELVLGTFVCMDCNAVIKNVEQQFKVYFNAINFIITQIYITIIDLFKFVQIHTIICSLQIQQFVIIQYVVIGGVFYWMLIILYLLIFKK